MLTTRCRNGRSQGQLGSGTTGQEGADRKERSGDAGITTEPLWVCFRLHLDGLGMI